jgi:hypothetical protein
MLRSVFTLAVAVFILIPNLATAQSVAEDAKAIADSKIRMWRSDVMEMKSLDDSVDLRVLQLEFAPPNKEKPDQLQVKLWLASPIEGNPDRNSSGAMTTGGFRDVMLTEKEGVKTITIRRSKDSVEKPNKNTERILARTAISYTYELKGDSLTLKGFSKDKVTTWGQLGFTVPQEEIVFKKWVTP